MFSLFIGFFQNLKNRKVFNPKTNEKTCTARVARKTTLCGLIFAKINPREKFWISPFVKINPHKIFRISSFANFL